MQYPTDHITRAEFDAFAKTVADQRRHLTEVDLQILRTQAQQNANFTKLLEVLGLTVPLDHPCDAPDNPEKN